jgi:hypothetical protein
MMPKIVLMIEGIDGRLSFSLSIITVEFIGLLHPRVIISTFTAFESSESYYFGSFQAQALRFHGIKLANFRQVTNIYVAI